MKKFLNIILSLIIIILLTIILTLSTLLKSQISHNNISKIVNKIDIQELINNVSTQDTDILSGIKETLNDIGIPENFVEKALNTEPTKNFVSTYLNNTVEYYLNNKENNITITDIKDLVKSNLVILEDDLPVQNQQYLKQFEQNIYDYIDNNQEEILNNFPSPKKLLENVDLSQVKIQENISLQDMFQGISFFISNNFIMILSFVIIIFLTILILLNRHNFKWAKIIGINSLIYCLLIFILQLSISFALNMVDIDNDIIKLIFQSLKNNLLIYIISSLIISIILLVISKLKKQK